jgi:hypothetical protein
MRAARSSPTWCSAAIRNALRQAAAAAARLTAGELYPDDDEQAEKLAPLGDPGLTGIRVSSTEVLEVPVAVLAGKLTDRLLREIVRRGTRGGPLEPLANQLNHDMTYLHLHQLGGTLARLDCSGGGADSASAAATQGYGGAEAGPRYAGIDTIVAGAGSS